jgi:ABC-type sugar transport system permease subunit
MSRRPAALEAARPAARPPPRGTRAARFDWLPRLVLAPSFVLSFPFIHRLIGWNGWLSLSASRLLPNYEFVGLEQYVALFGSVADRVRG